MITRRIRAGQLAFPARHSPAPPSVRVEVAERFVPFVVALVVDAVELVEALLPGPAEARRLALGPRRPVVTFPEPTTFFVICKRRSSRRLSSCSLSILARSLSSCATDSFVDDVVEEVCKIYACAR